MNTSKGFSVGFVLLAFGLSGCAAALVGAGAAGGYALSKDSVKNHYDRSKERVFKTSLSVLKEKGAITLKDPEKGIIKARVNEEDVAVTVKPVTQKSTELVVEARNKFMMPAIEVAQDVYDEIDLRLQKKGWLFD